MTQVLIDNRHYLYLTWNVIFILTNNMTFKSKLYDFSHYRKTFSVLMS